MNRYKKSLTLSNWHHRSTDIPLDITHYNNASSISQTHYLYTMADIFTDDELSEMREIFDEHDTDKDGNVNTEELLLMITRLGVDATPDDVKFVIKTFDTDKNGKLDYNEFLELIKVLQNMDE
ncbi:hypothetical protein BGZ98_009426 [Dissophora globulifera]|nr:hypothetical protein BGZ98_009426 [Dissophora globulifera]